MPHKDKYSDYPQLSIYEDEDPDGNADYRILIEDRTSEILIFTPHGGKIERRTSKIARRIAGGKYSLYLFEGTKSNCNFETLHITSTNFNKPKCLKLLGNAKIAIAIYGKSGQGEKVLVGGRNQNLAEEITKSLSSSGFDAKTVSSGKFSGTSKENICNRTSTNQGVQLEIMRGLRNKMAENSELLEKFAKSIQSVLNSN